MKQSFLVFGLIFLMSCQHVDGQKMGQVECSQNIKIKYVETTKQDITDEMVADTTKNNLVVYLESYFNGRVKAYIGERQVFDETVETEESLGTTSKYFTYDYSEDRAVPKVKINYGNECIEVKIDRNYKLVFIHYYENNWELIYSNVYPTYE